jgi:hypothetical protein
VSSVDGVAPARRASGRRAPALIAAAIAALTLVAAAHADGDPASDYLIVQKVFFPIDVKFPAGKQQQLASLVDAANRAGFKLRVALIANRYDMGSVTSLYRKPRAYARFLGTEISFAYGQRLLVVMPNGFGFNWPKHSTAPAYAMLGRIPMRPGNLGLLNAAETAVHRLAAADGIEVTASADSARHGSDNRLLVVGAAAGALVAAAAAVVALRLRRR